MGLMIYYSGRLRNPDLISDLVQEVADIAQSMLWSYEILEAGPEDPVSGILVAPEGSEPLWLTFHKEGFMCNPMLYDYVLQIEGHGIPADAEQFFFTKTQYAGVEAHMAMIRLMRHLSQKYFEHFELQDESQYWETNDEALCRQRFDQYNKIMDMVGDALNGMTFDPDESQESLLESIEKMLTERFGAKRME